MEENEEEEPVVSRHFIRRRRYRQRMEGFEEQGDNQPGDRWEKEERDEEREEGDEPFRERTYRSLRRRPRRQI